MKLSPNTYLGLTWGLKNFDGIETDIRLSRDNELVIYHDSHLPTGEYISELTLSELQDRDIPTLTQFLSIPRVRELSEDKQLFIELKPNCIDNRRIVKPISDQFYSSFQRSVEQSGVNKENISIISFVKDLLDPFVETYSCYPLIPDVNECSSKWVVLKAMPQVLGTSLAAEIKRAHDRGFAGVFFARQYVMGLISLRHPSYEKAVDLAKAYNMLLGSNLGDPEKESDYPAFARFSDKLADYPRYAKKGDGPIIAHRGTGTKGVEVPDQDVPELSI